MCKLSAVAWLYLLLWHSIITVYRTISTVCLYHLTFQKGHFIIISSFITIDSNVVWVTRGGWKGECGRWRGKCGGSSGWRGECGKRWGLEMGRHVIT